MKSNAKTSDCAERYLLTLNETAAMLGISRETLYRKIDGGLFPKPIKQGNRSYFKPSDVQIYLDDLKRKLNKPIKKI